MFLGIIKKHKILVAFVVVSVVLCVSIKSYAAEDSLLVTNSDGRSYNGLPAFPATYKSSTNQYDFWCKFNDYILYQDSSTLDYYLVCSAVEDGKLYNNKGTLSGTGYHCQYKSDLTTVLERYDFPSFDVFKCSPNGTSWVHIKSTTIPSMNYADTLVQSSCDIYSDSTLTSVFTKSATDLLISEMSSTDLVKILKSQVVSLIPSLIFFLILLVGFWKAWGMLRRTLQAV